MQSVPTFLFDKLAAMHLTCPITEFITFHVSEIPMTFDIPLYWIVVILFKLSGRG